ncbi:MAG: LrgB family protein [Bacteroidaceae bacterium]|nr:LrgB family protein [Bacteroidaceae bacterium]
MEILNNNIVLLALTFGIFYGARQLQKLTGWIVLNPILVTIVVLIALLKASGISYETYSAAGSYIEFWLRPAIVALGVPLYRHLGQIRRQFLPIFLSQLAGCVVGLVSVVGIAHVAGASRETVISLAPKSVTTPIAMEVCRAMGGIPSLTAAIVVTVGLFGAVFGFKVLEVWHVKNPYSQGLSIGTASHAVGTSRAMEKGQTYGTYASLGLILNGLLTALLAPLVLRLMGIQ